VDMLGGAVSNTPSSSCYRVCWKVEFKVTIKKKHLVEFREQSIDCKSEADVVNRRSPIGSFVG